MFIPPLPPRPVRLLSADGQVWVYPTLLTFVEAHSLYWISLSVGLQFRVPEKIHASGEVFYRHHSFILRDTSGDPLTYEDCEKAWKAARPTGRRSRFAVLYPFWNGEGPVPGTGKIKAGRHSFRYIRTAGAHRAAVAVLREEGEPAFRPARAAYLPTAWDDLQISARRERSWKRHRRAKWTRRSRRA